MKGKIVIKHKYPPPRISFNVRNPFTFLGDVEIQAGNRIIKNISAQNRNSSWKAVCFHKHNCRVYVCKSTISSKPDPDTKWWEQWSGELYDMQSGLLLYSGSFHYFCKHDRQALDYTYDLATRQLLSIYKGSFVLGSRHCSNQTAGWEYWKQPKGDFIITGSWQNGKKQGKFDCKSVPASPQPILLFFQNDIQVDSLHAQQLTQRESSFQDWQRYNMLINQRLRRGYQPREWVTSGGVDYAICRLVESYSYSKKYYQLPVKALSIDFFQKLAPSKRVAREDLSNVADVHDYFDLYKNTVSIFQAFPILLLPFNQDASHFVLAAIRTEIFREKGVLKQVKFRLYHLDPLIGSPTIIFNHLIRLIRFYVQENLHASEKRIYYEAIKEVSQKDSEKSLLCSTKLRVSTQTNYYDCGIYVILYACLLIGDIAAKGVTTKWNFPVEAAEWFRITMSKELKYGDYPLLFEQTLKRLQQ